MAGVLLLVSLPFGFTIRNDAMDLLPGDFMVIPAGEFWMGTQGAELLPDTSMARCSPGRSTFHPNEGPRHRVVISRDLEIGRFEVTQEQWTAVMGFNPGRFVGPRLPVDGVSWDEIQEFLRRLNALKDDYLYRLPTEAEWEYASRAGGVSDYPPQVDAVAWYGENAGGRTHPVGSKKSNDWGLYDMYGNVAEWVGDLYGHGYYSESPTEDPQGPDPASLHERERRLHPRVLRGGSICTASECIRPAIRMASPQDNNAPFLGFRLVRERRYR